MRLKAGQMSDPDQVSNYNTFQRPKRPKKKAKKTAWSSISRHSSSSSFFGNSPTESDEVSILMPQSIKKGQSSSSSDEGHSKATQGEDFYTLNDVGSENHIPILRTTRDFRTTGMKEMVVGMVLSILSGMFMIAATSIDKYLEVKVSPWHVVFAVGLAHFFIGFPLHVASTIADCRNPYASSFTGRCHFGMFILGPEELRTKVIVQGILGTMAAYGIYHAADHVDIGQSEAVFYSAPLMTMIFSICLLGEPVKLYRSGSHSYDLGCNLHDLQPYFAD